MKFQFTVLTDKATRCDRLAQLIDLQSRYQFLFYLFFTPKKISIANDHDHPTERMHRHNAVPQQAQHSNCYQHFGVL